MPDSVQLPDNAVPWVRECLMRITSIIAFLHGGAMKTMRSISSIFMLVFALFTSTAFAQDLNERLNTLEETVKIQQQTIEQQQKTVDALKEEVEQQKDQTPPQAAKDSSPKASGLFGGSAFTNPNLSMVLDTFAYDSNLSNAELQNQGIPGFTTNGLEWRNGFNLDAAELFLFSPVDPYSNMYVNIPFSENAVTIEEAYIVTTDLPAGWQAKIGKFKSNFSRIDAQHPHAWDFFDIALPYRAFLGDEGLGGEKGVQITYLPVFSIYTQLGVEFLQGENSLLFGPNAGQGPHAFTFFVKSSIDTSDYSTLYFGPSVLFGKTDNTSILTNVEVRGNSALYGMEAVWKWKPTSREALTVQAEYLLLTQAGNTEDPLTHIVINPMRRKQDGFYIQTIYRKNRWGVGARYDVLDILSDTFTVAGVQQDFGCKPHRETASLEYNPSEFTRVRLQLAHDQSDPTGRTNNEAILQLNLSIGAHPAHSF
jgi:hypothetical protein